MNLKKYLLAAFAAIALSLVLRMWPQWLLVLSTFRINIPATQLAKMRTTVTTTATVKWEQRRAKQHLQPTATSRI